MGLSGGASLTQREARIKPQKLGKSMQYLLGSLLFIGIKRGKNYLYAATPSFLMKRSATALLHWMISSMLAFSSCLWPLL
jgi:hypothetical protein